MNKHIFVTQPDLPPIEELTPFLERIWKNKILTNSGEIHVEFEHKLAEFLGVPYVSLFANGTMALMAAIDVLELKGKVITTPYSFVATSSTLLYKNIEPVFSDIKQGTYNLDPEKIVEKIDEHTTAIMPVHVYGYPCEIEAINEIALKYNLKVLYDAAHAFGVNYKGKSVLNYGDASVLSFHATKSFNTFEGGAVITSDPNIKANLDRFKNFGFESETIISSVGINAKLNEFQSAIGLLNLKYFEEKKQKRKQIDSEYRNGLSKISELELSDVGEISNYNFAYFPVYIRKNKKFSRDELYIHLRDNNILVRRYFYPLITDFELYKDHKRKTHDISNAVNAAESVICLPIYSEMKNEDVDFVINTITGFISKLNSNPKPES